jgi:STE24 endopeptidase
MGEEERARRYHRRQLGLTIASLVLGVLFLVGVLVTGVARDIVEVSAGVSAAWWWKVGVVTTVLGVAHALLVLPLGWLRGYVLPRREGLLHQPVGSWLGDRLKAAVLGGVLTLAGVEVVYGLLRVTRWWWLAAAAVFFAGQVVMAVVVPVWVLPLFYRMRPLEPGPLRDRLQALAGRVGVAVVGVGIVDHSRKSRTANAAVVGLGPTRRIVLFDTLVDGFEPAEIEAVVAHELGHHVHGDIARGLTASGVLTLATFVAADAALRVGVPLWRLNGPADPAGLPWLGLIVLALGLCAMPFTNAVSRWMERQADDFALATTRDPDAFVGAMERLARLNLAERRPHRLEELVLYSHPPIDRRIARARAAVASGPGFAGA